MAEPLPSRRTLALATLGAAAVAGLVLLLFVLPAEYGVDPTGVGHLTGVSRLSDTPATVDAVPTINKVEPRAPRNDTVTFTLNGLLDMEYKFHLDANQSLLYSWSVVGGVVNYDFHGEPDKPARAGDFTSYEAKQGAGASGSFQAPFTGRHGWYFQNVGPNPVTITLHTWGYYDVIGPLH